ncbi:MAG TPA: thioredoxin family protein [Aquificaceae bacterium]|nr:thioredoxin family protein [Aquificaceae bacterium]
MKVFIEILESDFCPKCKVVKERVLKVAREMGVQVKVLDPVKDIHRITELKLLTSPAVVINGKVKFAGIVPSEEKIRMAIKEELS